MNELTATAHHDVGGAPGHEPIPREQHAFLPWELRVDALMWILGDAGRPGGRRMTVDELRRGIESLSPDQYRSLGYYEKWLTSLVAIMREKGIVSGAELRKRLAEVTIAHEGEHALEHAGDEHAQDGGDRA
ncbi:MAG: nitrile hydratase subunit beta [Candidatus Eremiobacteraeota bacterium]|nr:nitrile hydratase subunit beta [Candidatus Eremiobacteraeota bacterium]